ncbi:hypothetical protein IW262DRAFT_347425 [Armillaria fumosa]|nr:hypothetical protein IW262DRAFT_347425 [Armillaria fumosa]
MGSVNAILTGCRVTRSLKPSPQWILCLLWLRLAIVLAFILNQDKNIWIPILSVSCLHLAMSLSHDLHRPAPFSRNSLPPRLDLAQDLKTRLAQLFRAENTLQLWKHTNPISLNIPPFNDIIISPSTQEYLSVEDAIKIVNEEMPPGYRLRKACQIRFQDKPVNDTGERRSVFLKDIDELIARVRWGRRDLGQGICRIRNMDLVSEVLAF